MKNHFLLIAITASLLSIQAMDLPVHSEIIKSLSALKADDLRQILEKIPELVNFTDESGKTLLMSAVEQNVNNETLDVVLKVGANVNAIDKQGRNALHFAAQAGNVNAAVYLVAKRLKPGIADADGNTPLHSLLKSNNERASDVAMTAQALLFSDFVTDYYKHCDFSLLLIQNSQNLTPVDIAFSRKNMPALSIFFKWAISGEVNPNLEAQRVMAFRVSEKILTHFKDNPEELTKLLSCYASDLHSLHKVKQGKARYKREKQEMEEQRAIEQFQQKP